MRNFAIKALWLLVVLAAYFGLFHVLMWSMENHPVAVLIVIAVGGIPVVVIGIRISGREEQRRCIWNIIRDSLDAELSLVPAAEQGKDTLAAGRINNVLFRFLKLDVNESGIRLDRHFAPVKPMVIPWSRVQRLDIVDTSKLKRHKDPTLNTGALIRLLDGETEILLHPWLDAHRRCVPDQIGRNRLVACK